LSYIQKLLGQDEQILLETKRHLFVLIGQILKELIILIVLIVGWFVIHGKQDPSFLWIQLALGIIALMVLVSIVFDFARWNNEAFYVTNRRVIHSSGILNKKVLDSSLSKINDVIMEQSFLGRMFNYGTIRILTASDEVINRVDRISKPVEFKKAMLTAKSAMEPIAAAQHAVVASAPTQLLEELAQLKQKGLISEEEYVEKRKEILKRM
jgi:uncharacterized membrane protein YdbT with pleckstrin-like domain